jgi:hypothetical protein
MGEVMTAELGAEMRGKKGNRGFGEDGVGGMGSERECIDVGESVVPCENNDAELMMVERGSCGEPDEELGRGGIGGSSSRGFPPSGI